MIPDGVRNDSDSGFYILLSGSNFLLLSLIGVSVWFDLNLLKKC